jgi:hypothetical protein
MGAGQQEIMGVATENIVGRYTYRKETQGKVVPLFAGPDTTREPGR